MATTRMRTLKLHIPHDALPTLDTFLKHTKEARVFRRAQAVRDVVKGQRLQNVSDTLQFTYSALRKWVHRFAQEGTQGLITNGAGVVLPLRQHDLRFTARATPQVARLVVRSSPRQYHP